MNDLLKSIYEALNRYLITVGKKEKISERDFEDFFASEIRSGIKDYLIYQKGLIYLSYQLYYNDRYESFCRSFIKQFRDNYFFDYLPFAKDIWLRDFMPIKTRDGRYVSFRYEPSYLKDQPELRTDYKRDLAYEVGVEVEYSDINLDGGNVVMSPSKKTAIISERVFSENPEREGDDLLAELERILAAKVIIIPALKSDMTGHADGMVRFVDETTVIGNRTPYENGHEQKIKKELEKHGIEVIDFPYFDSPGISAIGTYLNFLETDDTIFLPIFGNGMDEEAISAAKSIFKKKIVPVRCEEIAKEGGCLNCISWEL